MVSVIPQLHEFNGERRKVGEPLKDSMHALMRLFLCSPDEEEANEGGVSMMTPAARPADGWNEIHCFEIIKGVPPAWVVRRRQVYGEKVLRASNL